MGEKITDKAILEEVSKLKKQKNPPFLLHYLATKICFQLGGKQWKDWNKRNQNYLGTKQLADGSWPDTPAPFLKMDKLEAKLYNDALASSCLQVYYRYLPSSKGAVQNIVVSASAFSSPSVYGGRSAGGRASAIARFGGTSAERYLPFVENGIQSPLKTPLSTFSVDVDTASYSNIRRMINDNSLPQADAVRIEEMLNYFRYKTSGKNLHGIFDVDFEMAPCSWKKDEMLLKTTISTEALQMEKLPPKNLVFLVDVSGSMQSPDKLALLKKSLTLLTMEMRKEDRISIVVYASASGVALAPTSGDKHYEIIEAIEKLAAGGSTNGSGGINKAYELAQKHFMADGINRILLCTDGDFNVGVTSHTELIKLIQEKAKSKVFLTVMGFGKGNLRDDYIEQLADKGNGQAFYIDTLLEAKKALVDEMGATLNTVAKDVKLQMEFNPAVVESYRLIGYENRKLNAEDFENDKVDAGEIGSGHQVTALYQIKLRDTLIEQPKLKYQSTQLTKSTEMLTLNVRYKKPDSDKSELFSLAFDGATVASPSADWQHCSSLALTGMLLRQSEYSGAGDFKMAQKLAKNGMQNDKSGYRKEFTDLLKKVETIKKENDSKKQAVIEDNEEEGLDLID